MSHRFSTIVLAWVLSIGCSQRAPLDAVTTAPPPPVSSDTDAGLEAPPSISTDDGPASAPPIETFRDADATAAEAPPEAGESPDALPVSPPPACAADCSTVFRPSGSLSLAGLEAAVVGRWRFCSGGDEWRTWAPADAVAVEFTALNGSPHEANATGSGDLYFLVAGPDGVLRRLNGSAYHLRYDVPTATQVDMFFDSGGAFFANPRYSPCPKQLELHLMYRPNATLHASLADGPADPAPPPLPACTSTLATSPAMSVDDFCSLFVEICGTGHAGYTTWTECRATYASLASTPNRRTCQSYHLCNASHGGAAATVHCPHAAGEVVCTQTN
jgi:hypothetical protein